MLSLQGKIVLITGLGQTSDEGWGIGVSIATLFARQGARIFGGNRSLTSAQRTQRRIEEEGGTCDVVETDVTNSNSVKSRRSMCSEAWPNRYPCEQCWSLRARLSSQHVARCMGVSGQYQTE